MRILPILPLMLAAPLAVAAGAADDGRGGEAGFFAGLVFPDEDVAGEAGPPPAATLGGRVGVVFARRWTWFVDGTYAEIDSETGFGAVEELTGRTGFELLLRPDSRFGWFLNAGAGWINFDYETPGDLDFDRPLGSLGGGQMIRWGATRRIRWEWRADLTLDDRGFDGVPVYQGRLVAGIVWGQRRALASSEAAAAATSGDVDGDGVHNRKDRCAGTPAGALVDSGGCPRDSDGDGVFDGVDVCPGTATFTKVDERGCLADADADGVHDGADTCPATPAGAAVDEWGCPEDRDGDGVVDGIDRCPGTPLGASVDATGCPTDTDRDGVPDGVDRCETTPDGAEVDRYGCAENER